MKTTLIVLVCIIAQIPAVADNREFLLGATKSTLKRQSLDVPRTIRQAMMLSCGGVDKYTRIILVRESRCFVIDGAKDLDVVRDFPVLPSDQVQKYNDSDLKEWHLPVVKGVEAVALLVEAEKKRALESKETSQEPPPAVNIPTSDSASVKPVMPPSANGSLPHATPVTTVDEEPTSSTPWSIIVVLIVAALGLLWLLLKRRS